ncbi:hypothetical protein ACSBPH_04625 [Microbacterium sp. F51-2R]|uniref:hypothetical protein n=1 Tax=Microbacterium sp. F51-2R TaxID=3445777 RepID=UPI003F9F744B
MESWAEIRRSHRAENVPIKGIARRMGIARRLGIARNTVRSALVPGAPPMYQGAGKQPLVDEVVPEIRTLRMVDVRMPVTVIAQRIGWQHS